MKRALALALIPGSIILLAACGTSATTPTTSGSSSQHMHMSSKSSSVDMVDLMFVQMMIPHHAQAVEMGTLAETRAQSPEIKALAAQIKAAQAPEIELMTGWLEQWGYPTDTPMDEGDMGHGMPGLLTDEQMDELKAASGAQFDSLYATYMIAHHEGAIEMAKTVEDSENPDVAALAAAIISSQTAEIAQLKAFLGQ